MKEFLIGRYQLGWRMVDLFACPDSENGTVVLMGDPKEGSYIRVGMKNSLEMAHGVLVHEVFEATYLDMGCALKPAAFFPDATDVWKFFFDHSQHTEISARAGYFLFKCHNDFVKAHKKCHAKRKK